MIKHPKTFKSPNNETRLWRYMDLPKLVSLFSKKALWFSRLDKLTDEFEGYVPVGNKIELFMNFKKLESPSEAEKRMEKEVKNIQKHKEWTLINSWTMGETESFALWKIYLSNSQYGVAIGTTFGDFVSSIEKSDLEIVPISVNYIDKISQSLPQINQVAISGSKSKFYSYENEFRAVIFNQFDINNKTKERTPKFEFGTYISVDLQKLIKSIYLSPGAPKWFSDVVYALIDKYEIPVTITQSFIRDKI